MKSHRLPFRRAARIAAVRPVLAWLLVALGGPLAAQAEPVTPSPGAQQTHFDFLGDYRRYYAEHEPLSYASIMPGESGAFGVTFTFASNLPGLQRIEWAEEGGEFRPLAGGKLFLPFDEKLDRAQDKSFRVRPVFSPAQPGSVHAIHINWMTRAAFAAAGGQRKRDIVKITSEPRLSYGTNRPESWKTFRPSVADVSFARKQWGHVVEGLTSDYEKAKALSRALITELRGCGGLPSAFIYDLSTFDKYDAIRSGRSKFACAQYSEIFSKACNVFGVINRWGFMNDGLENDAVLIELGSSHLVTEIFDRALNQWIHLDGHAHTLGAYLGEVGPLTLHEFLLFLNQPNRRPHLRVVIFDPETGRERTVPVDESGKAYLSYRGWTKGFHTTYRPEP